MESRGQQNSSVHGLRITDYGLPPPSYLEQAIWQTLRYFDLFALPLTATQLWRFLLVPHPEAPVRWEGHSRPSLRGVRDALVKSPWLMPKIDSQWGYYHLKDRPGMVEQRLVRHALAQHKWKILRRVARVLAWVPLVKMMAGSGSLALYNTKPSSDLDVFVVTDARRIWTARLLLLFVTQLTGRRRKHWDYEAPDKVCLNHYVTSEALLISPTIRNPYTAVLYTHLIPLTGPATFTDFHEANTPWLKRFAMYSEVESLPSPHYVPAHGLQKGWQRLLTSVLREPIADGIEKLAAYVQRRVIAAHTRPGEGGRVVVTGRELAFHPHSKVDGLLNQFAQDSGQKTLL